MGFIHYIPIATALFAAFFFVEIFQHWRKSGYALHLGWWTLGVFFYGAGPITESINTIFGYSPVNFKTWYILGAICGAAPLAQGTVYLLLKRKWADILSVVLIMALTVSAVTVILSPLKPVTEQYIKLNSRIFEWEFVRMMTPFINMYAFIFLVGGAIYSAVQYSRDSIDRSRFWGNILIATGALIPGIGGISAKFGYIEALYISGLIGICCIHAGYQIIKSGSEPSIYPVQAKHET
jgi:hypothetical protein